MAVAAAPEPKPAPAPPPPPPPPAPEPELEPVPQEDADASMDILPPPDPAPAPAKGGALKPLLLVLLLVALAAGGFVAWKFWLDKEDPKLAENTNSTQPAENTNSTQPAENKEPAKEEPKAPPKPALTQAREHLAGPADPAESVNLAGKLREERDGADASFLLVEDAAQKGNAEAQCNQVIWFQ